jgi:hypothetical protein
MENDTIEMRLVRKSNPKRKKEYIKSRTNKDELPNFNFFDMFAREIFLTVQGSIKNETQ